VHRFGSVREPMWGAGNRSGSVRSGLVRSDRLGSVYIIKTATIIKKSKKKKKICRSQLICLYAITLGGAGINRSPAPQIGSVRFDCNILIGSVLTGLIGSVLHLFPSLERDLGTYLPVLTFIFAVITPYNSMQQLY
jgi:hypothetical protein